MAATRTGTVERYDPTAGYGTVVDASGRSWWFHCTAIADGSRSIGEGARVVFGLTPGRLGRWEAADLTPVA